MKTEKRYEFRKHLNIVHKPDRRDFSILPKDNEVMIKDGWQIVISDNASTVIEKVAKDLQDYFFTSMNTSLLLKKLPAENIKHEENCIIISSGNEIASISSENLKPKTCMIDCMENCIIVNGYDDRQTSQGCYYLEDLMNFAQAPVLPIKKINRKALFSPRMSHSGWGEDQFPDQHLSALAHAGMDSILLFVKDVDKTPHGYLDFNDLIHRAKEYGLGVYFYSYIKSLMHPKEKGAEAFYENTYGNLFKNCPDAKGVILVGESCEFPSKDENTTMCLNENVKDKGFRNTKPSPGWWPCHDYPEWLNMLKKKVRAHTPNADIVFWTYNWGYAPEEDRIKLVESLPEDITLLVTFEMFEQVKTGNITSPIMDYTISIPGPGKYFVSEAEAAKRKNIKLYTMSNTGGMTWDFGVIPYEPVPQQWDKRHQELQKAQDKWGLCGLMENHHYGFFPSFIGELAKNNFFSPSFSTEEFLEKIALRDFDKDAAPHAIKAWENWSEAIGYYTPSNEVQYGPARIGPSYPLVFHPDITRTFLPQEIKIPDAPYAKNGSRIVKTFFHPFENVNQTPGMLRIPVELEKDKEMYAKWKRGVEDIEEACRLTPEKKKIEAEKMLTLGKFILNTIQTIINVKEWWLLNMKLMNETNPKNSEAILTELEKLAKKEIANAEATIPIVESDSRLGWEPSAEYLTDREHLEWKIEQVNSVINNEIATYRKMLSL